MLAVLLLATSVPIISFASDNAIGEGKTNYLFAYFNGSDENVRFALSDDGINFEAVNGGDAVLRNDASEVYGSVGVEGKAASGCARDPYVFEKADGSGYYILTTDLASSTGWQNSKLLCWEINDLGRGGRSAMEY